jgi:hypothetical protein
MISKEWKEFGDIPIGSGTIYSTPVSIKDLKALIVPEYKWTWRLSSDDSTRFYSLGSPCWVHRLIQRVILGIIWEKL